MIHSIRLFTLLALAAMIIRPQSVQAAVAFEKGDSICIIGNVHAERQQHFGYAEALLHQQLPQHNLTIRNLGHSGDEVTARNRVDGFGSEDDYLKKFKTDVVFIMFGYGESFAGPGGVDGFKKALGDRIKHITSQKYNGESNARVVVFTPIAHEDIGDPNFPDGKAINKNLKLYADAARQVASANKVPFVDLFTPSLKLFNQTKANLTTNGIYLTAKGHAAMAPVIVDGLLAKGAGNATINEKLRKAVVDKNWYWHQRYRVTDGFNVYGGRSHKAYAEKLTNRTVMDREMEILEVQAANRDKVVWAIAKGGDLKPDDSNTPPHIPVKTNRPGKLPGGKHEFLSDAKALSTLKLGKNLKANIFASHEQFPELVNPVQMAFDAKGRLWVAAWPTYPHWKPQSPMNDKLIILKDTDGDGKADKRTVFAGDLSQPTGFEFWNGGVVVSLPPHIVYLKDTDGDDVADYREILLHGICAGDTHHAANSFVYGPGGGIYFQEGTFHRTSTDTPYGPVRMKNGAVWRLEPRTGKFYAHTAYNFANPHGHVFDRWGQDFIHDGTGAVPYIGAVFTGRTYGTQKHGRAPVLYKRRTRPCGGTEILSSSHFPESSQGNFLIGNVIGFQGILQYKFQDKGSAFTATEIEPVVYADPKEHPNFRPIDIEIGPDGAIYFTDWVNPIIGHLQHHIRDPSRDVEHGRVYRITYEGRPLLKAPKIDGASTEELLELLKSKEDRVRYRARIELSSHDSKKVIAATKKWLAGLDKSGADFEHHQLEGLWVHQQHNVVDEALLKRVLASKNFRARAAATRVIGYWQDRLSSPLALLTKSVNDDAGLVRLEAVRALSFVPKKEAANVALQATKHKMDEFLNYTLKETLNALKHFQ